MSSRLPKKEIIKELIKCGRDPIYFIDNYCKIQHPTRGLIEFKLFNYQKDVINAFINNRMNVFLKARQLGLTTVTSAYVAWFILFHRDRNVLAVSIKQDTAKNIIRTIRTIYKHLPKWMIDFGKINLDNRFSIELDNGSRVKAAPTTDDVGRSEALSLLIVDEVAMIKNFEEIWTGLKPTVTAGGSVALFSTPKGTGNFFHQCWVQAKNKENNFNCHLGRYVNPNNPAEVYDDRLMWWVMPGHDEVWFASETAGSSPRDIAQEYLCSFNASGDTFLDASTISEMETKVRRPIRTLDSDRNVWIWEEPDPSATYLIGCDVSRGDAQDYSAFHVFRLDVHPLEQVAEYKGKIKPDHLGLLLVEVSKLFNNAYIAPEYNSGWSGPAILRIQESNHPFLYYSRKRKPAYKDIQIVDPYFAQDRNDYYPGYSVTSANRNAMLAKVEQYCRLSDIHINSSRTVDEFKTFIVTDFNRAEAQRGMSDDLIMSLAGTLWVRDEAFLNVFRTDDIAKAMLDGTSTSKNPTSQYKDFNFATSGMNRTRISEYVDRQNKIVLSNGQVESLAWLISKG